MFPGQRFNFQQVISHENLCENTSNIGKICWGERGLRVYRWKFYLFPVFSAIFKEAIRLMTRLVRSSWISEINWESSSIMSTCNNQKKYCDCIIKQLLLRTDIGWQKEILDPTPQSVYQSMYYTIYVYYDYTIKRLLLRTNISWRKKYWTLPPPK